VIRRLHDADALITTTNPVTGSIIPVTIASGQSTWDPTSAVVFVGARAGERPSAETCCDYLNMFTGRDTATTWTRTHTDVTGEVLTHTDAELLGRHIFGDLFT